VCNPDLLAIDICAWAVMSNHYYPVIRPCSEQLDGLTNDQIIDRCDALFKGPPSVQRYREGDPLLAPELSTIEDIVIVVQPVYIQFCVIVLQTKTIA
jgi:hypothetical protein